MYKSWQEMNVRERAQYLVNTSAQDMHSSLGTLVRGDLAVLRAAVKITKRRGEKTKVRMLQSAIRKLEKNP